MDINKMLKEVENVPTLEKYYNAALYYYEKNELDSAVFFAKKALELDQNNIWVNGLMERICFDKSKYLRIVGKHREELTILQEALIFVERSKSKELNLEDNYEFGVSPVKRRIYELKKLLSSS